MSTESLFRRGIALLYKRQFLRARRLLTKAATTEVPEQVWAAQELIQTFLRRGERAEAEPYLRSVLQPPLLNHALGYLFRRTGRRDEAEAELRTAFGHRPKVWASANELGYILTTRGDAEGERLLRRAAAHFRRSGDKWGLSSALFWAGAPLFASWRLREAVTRHEHIIEAKRACGDEAGLAVATLNLGLAHYYLGDYRASVHAYEEAADALGRVGERRFQAIALNGVSLCRLELNDFAGAMRALRAEAWLFHRIGDDAGLAGALHNLGYAARRRGDYQSARAFLARAIAQLRRGDDREARGTAVATLAEVETCAGSGRAALRLLRNHRRALVGGSTRLGILIAREEARAWASLGRHGRAAQCARRALVLARSIPGPARSLVGSWIEAERILGDALLQGGRPAEAIVVLRRAAGHVERMLSRQRGTTARIGLLETHRAAHDSWILALLVLGDVNSAWDVVARLKARELGSVTIARSNDALAEIEAELNQLSSLPKLIPAQVSRLRTLRRRHAGLSERLESRAKVPSRHAAIHQRRFGPGIAVIEFHVMEQRTLAFAVSASSSSSVEIGIGERPLGRLIDQLLEPLVSAGAAADASASLSLFDPRLAHRLFRRLVRPVLRGLGTEPTQIWIVPSGPLHRLPFEVLVFGFYGVAGAPSYVVERYQITYAPSSRLLPSRRPSPAARPLLVAHSPANGSVLQTADGPVEIASLPAATREVLALSSLYPEARTLIGGAATVAAFHDALERRSTAIHIAAHASVDERIPDLSGLVLAPRVPGRGAELLTAAAIARGVVHADLVALSACQSGAGRLRSFEGMQSLSRAFLKAGSRAVLGTLWPVDDETSMELMLGFHQRLRAGLPRSLALTEAKRALRLRHPYYWGPFVLLDQDPFR